MDPASTRGSASPGRAKRRGASALTEALSYASRSGEATYDAETHRLKGELLLDVSGQPKEAEAEDCFRRAIEIARQREERILELRAVRSLARLFHERGERDEARSMLAGIYSWFTEGFDTPDLVEARALLEELHRTMAAVPAPPSAREADARDGYLHREGDYWTVTYEEKVFRLRDTKGLRYLDHLLRHPGKEFHALELAPVANDGVSGEQVARSAPTDDSLAVSGLGDAGEVLDARARAEYRERLDDLGRELDEATADNDLGRAERLRSEIEALEGELAAAVGLGGRSRKAASATEKARVNLTKAIQAAIVRIGGTSPGLGSHLETTIRTGTFFGYLPNRRGPRG